MLNSPTSHRFLKKHHLRDKASFDHVFKAGHRFSSGNILFLFKPNEYKHARLGLAISKKVLKSSVKRQRFKRLFRELFRLNQKELPCVDMVIILRPGIQTLEKDQQWVYLEQQWKKWIARCR